VRILPRTWAADALIACAIGLTAFVIGATYSRIPDVQAGASYFQETMGPAVAFACGHGLAAVSAPGLDAFLARRADTFDCSQLSGAARDSKLTALQSASRYLMIGLGLAWMVGGVSWSGLWWFYGGLFASVAVLAFASARLAFGRILSALIAIALMTSTLQLGALPHLRDYSKAPFFAAMTLLTMLVLLRPQSPRALLGWSAVAGAVMGIAFGVRFDMTMMLAIFMSAVVFATPGSLREQWKQRLAAVGAGAAAFVLLALPVILSFELGNNTFHVVLLGFAEPHEAALALSPPPYHLGTLYNDSFISAVVNTSWQRQHGSSRLFALDTPEYGQAASEYFRHIALQFPADLVVRAWAAVAKLFQLPFEGSVAVPTNLRAGALESLLLSRATVVGWINWLAPWAAVLAPVALVAAAAVNVRVAALAIGACLVLGGMTSLQFQSRHVFHLELLALLALGTAAHGVARLRRRPEGERWSPMPVAILAAILILASVVPTWALRRYQDTSVRALFARYDAAVVSEAPIVTTNGTTSLVTMASMQHPSDEALSASFLAAAIGGPACDFDEVSGTIRYEAAQNAADFSRPFAIRVPMSGQPARLWFAVYEHRSGRADSDYRFAGLEVPTARIGCVVGIGRVAAATQPLWIDGTQDSTWADRPLFARLVTIERGIENHPVTYVSPPDADFTRSELSRTLTPLPAAEYVASVAAIEDQRVAVQGIASPAGYLVSWPAGRVPRSRVLIAEGELRSGGLVVGLERNNSWAAQVPVTTRGPFRIAIRVPEDGDYRPVIANNRAGGALWTSLTIERIGWTE
jgi:hypothetical protein